MMRRPPYSLRHDGYLDRADNGFSNELDFRYPFEVLFLISFLSRENMNDPFSSELKGSPGFESVTTAYKNVLNSEADDVAGNRQQIPAGELELLFLTIFWAKSILCIKNEN